MRLPAGLALLRDRAFMNRVKRHYWMFRAEIDGTDTAARADPAIRTKRCP